MEQTAPILDAEHADVRNEDHELMDFERFEQTLVDSLVRHQEILLNLSNLVQAIEMPPSRERVQIRSLDSARGVAELSDGRRLFLPRVNSPGAPPLESIMDALAEGGEVEAVLSHLPDGSIYASAASSTLGVDSKVVQQVDPRRLALRITPVDFGLPNFDLAERHYLEAYKWGFTENLSRHYFEFNQAFAVIRYLSLGGGDNYKHWLKIDVDTNNDGFYGTLVYKMDENSKPFVLRRSDLPEFKAFSIRVREFRAPITETGLGTAEVINEEFHVIEVNRTGLYAEASYDETAFDLKDSPSETGHGVARVTQVFPRFPLTLQPAEQMTFRGASFKAVGNGSTYPNIFNIGLNEPFAVHYQDPNEFMLFANPDDVDKGIYGPKLRGYNNGRLFSYRVTLPFIARDRLHDCPGSQPDTFYRIPFSGVYSISQGNNGQFTHNGWQRFAWDFPKAANTAVLAARGGRVVDLRESSSQSCWNPNAANPDGTTGACQNCMGSASANFVTIRHRDGTFAWYGHFRNNSVWVSLNQRVYRGTPLGGVGTTGCSTGNHLHFHVVNPEQTSTIPVRFEAYTLPSFQFEPCLLPPSNSAGLSTN
jgi:murein DD-endopeptidase MepM/ murein hydrolase activator NlpD